MKNSTKSLLLIIMVLCFGVKSFANSNDDDSDFLENEGRLIFKIRGFGMLNKSSQKGLPPAQVTPALPVKAMFRNGGGVDTSTGIFFNDNIAAEISLGVMVFNMSRSSLSAVSYNYNGNTVNSNRKNVFMIPLSVTAQYYIAPFGGIRPYLGAGYYAAYAVTKASEYKISNTHGPVLQLGVDFVAKDDTVITFDVRWFSDKFKVNYQPVLVNNTPVSSTIKISSLVFSVGLGLKF